VPDSSEGIVMVKVFVVFVKISNPFSSKLATVYPVAPPPGNETELKVTYLPTDNP
jgi:hypothetical protein